MKDRYIKFGYNITTDPHFQDEKYGIDKNLQRKIEQLGLKSMDEKNTKIIEELTEMIVKYPTVPILKNYLSVAYNVRGNYEKATEINRWTIAEHPDYLFARLNEANDFMNREEFDKVPEILGELLEIKAMYPDRDLFHLGELTNFMKTVIRYFALTGQYDLAENRLDILRKIAPGHPDLEEAKNLYFYALTKNATDRFEEENQLRITPKQLKFAKETGFNIPPAFTFPVVSLLYDFSNDLPEEIINKILDLPRETLIKDLEKLIDDAVSRYGFFLIDEESPADFLIHAFVFLAELNSEKSIHKVLDILEYDDDFLEFWLGDHITETLWNCLYKIGQNQTEVLNEFLLKPGIDTFAKSAIADTLCQIALHQPLRKPEIEKIFADIFNRFLAATNADNLIDSSFLSMAIGSAIDTGFHKLLPVIKRLYDKEIVDIGMNGDYNDVEKLFNEPDTFDHKRELLDIYDLYRDFNTKFGSFDEEDDDDDFNFSGLKDKITPAVSLKIGRNDPCPCGSGLKYKKCCGK